jgi:hypothetical protein
MFGLLCVPYEVLANIVGNIDFDDVFNLALACKELKFLIEEESICKSIVQVSKFHLTSHQNRCQMGYIMVRLPNSAADDT